MKDASVLDIQSDNIDSNVAGRQGTVELQQKKVTAWL